MTSDSNCNIIEHLNRDFEKWQEKDNSDLIYLLEVIRPTFSHLSHKATPIHHHPFLFLLCLNTVSNYNNIIRNKEFFLMTLFTVWIKQNVIRVIKTIFKKTFIHFHCHCCHSLFFLFISLAYTVQGLYVCVM